MSDFRRVNISNVDFVFINLDSLVYFDRKHKNGEGKKDGKTVECSADNPQANWNVSFTMDEERAKKFYNMCQDHFKACCGKKEPFGAVHGYSETDFDDKLQMRFRASRKAKDSKGKLQQQPAVVDAYDVPLENRRFFNGSKGDIVVTMFPADNPSTNKKGISLIVNKVTVTNPIYGAEEYEDFDDVKSSMDAPNFDRDMATEFDEEIPF